MSSVSESEHQQHTSFIKTPQQLIVVVLASFLVPIIGIILLVQLVISKPSADPNAMTPESVAARLQPVGRVEIAAPAAAPGARSGEDIVKAVCSACHQTGVANAPKIGDKAAWAPRLKEGLNGLLASATKGKGAMPPKGGAADLTDTELARAIVFMANQSGGSLKAPPAAAAKSKEPPAPKPAARK
jgi:cytochrome c5